MIVKLLLILPSFTSIITADYVCHNQTMCQWTSSASSCSTLCADGCIILSRDQNNNINCINNTKSDPIYSIDFGNGDIYSQIISKGPFNYSSLIKFLNSSEFLLMKTDYKNNIYGEGVSCPYGCFEKNHECVPLSTKYICYPEQQLQCPTGCIYNMATNSCTTNELNTICEINKKYKKCPYLCTYDYNNDNCYSQSPRVICNLGYMTICPINCDINYYNECVPNTDLYNSDPLSICHHIPTPQCRNGCYYNFTTEKCLSSTNDQFCEAYVNINCKNGYDYNLNNINSCDYNMKNNINDICLKSNYIKFPLSMIEKYKNIKCKYSDIYCSNNGCVQGYCPTYVNQCYSN